MTKHITGLLLLIFSLTVFSVISIVADADADTNDASVQEVQVGAKQEEEEEGVKNPQSSKPPKLPKPNLPFGDINLLVVSDVHSFVGGHPHEPDRNADYGDLYSFHERLKEYVYDNDNDDTAGGGDLWLINNGDWLHGTGLAMDGNATNLIPIINSLPWDAMTMGNHEAMYTDVLRDMKESMLPTFPGKYVTSNVLVNTTTTAEDQPFGVRYRFMKGRSSTVLVFGFLHDVLSVKSISETIKVVPVEDVLEERWFKNVLTNHHETYDAIVVMAHMHHDDPLVDSIRTKIRELLDQKKDKKRPNMPIQFITGKSHVRSYTESVSNDKFARTVSPGGLFDTIGWVTIPKHDKVAAMIESSSDDTMKSAFSHRFLNTSKSVLRTTIFGSDDDDASSLVLRTDKGNEVSKLIRDTQTKLELDQLVACPGIDFLRNVSMHAENSLWKLWKDHVVKSQIFQRDGKNRGSAMIVSKRAFRYDLKGRRINKHDDDAMTLDDVIAIAPYMEKVIYVGDVPDWMIRRMNITFNSQSSHNAVPDYVLASEGMDEEIKTVPSYQLYTHEIDLPKIKTKLEKFNFQNFKLRYTGNRDTLYWLDYVRVAFPCDRLNQTEQENIMKIKPYFYDPNELGEEETTDGTLTYYDDDEVAGNIDDDDDDDVDVDAVVESNKYNKTWTIPPESDYLGYVPDKGETHTLSNQHYDKYKSKDEIEKEKKEKEETEKEHDLKTQLKERKKAMKKIIKGFALIFAGMLLLIPVYCLITQIICGRNFFDDDDNEYGGIGAYDKEEVESLQKRRRQRQRRQNNNKNIYNILPRRNKQQAAGGNNKNKKYNNTNTGSGDDNYDDWYDDRPLDEIEIL